MAPPAQIKLEAFPDALTPDIEAALDDSRATFEQILDSDQWAPWGEENGADDCGCDDPTIRFYQLHNKEYDAPALKAVCFVRGSTVQVKRTLEMDYRVSTHKDTNLDPDKTHWTVLGSKIKHGAPHRYQALGSFTKSFGPISPRSFYDIQCCSVTDDVAKEWSASIEKCVPDTKGVVRAAAYPSGLRVMRVEKGVDGQKDLLKMEYMVHICLRGYLPSWTVQSGQKGALAQIMKTAQKSAQLFPDVHCLANMGA